MITQSDIDYMKRDGKKFYLPLPSRFLTSTAKEIAWREAVRSAVKPDTYIERYHFPKGLSPRRFRSLMGALCLFTIAAFLALENGYLDFLSFLFQ